MPHPFEKSHFTSYRDLGCTYFCRDFTTYPNCKFYEGKGFGQVKIKPSNSDITVEIFVTHLQSGAEKYEYIRKLQTAQLMEQVDNSTADIVIVGGDFNSFPSAEPCTGGQI